MPFHNIKKERKFYECVMCNKSYSNIKMHEKSKKHVSNCCTFIECKTAMEGNCKRYIYNDIKTIDPYLFIMTMKEKRKKVCSDQEWKSFKFGIAIHVLFYRINPDGVKTNIDAWFNGGCMERVEYMDFIHEVLFNKTKKIEKCIEEFIMEKSGWIIKN